MENQQQPDPLQPTADELSAAYGIRLGQALIEKIALEKLAAQMRSQIEAQAQNEARLQAHIHDLETRIAEFTKQEYDFTDHIQALELELDEIKTASRGGPLEAPIGEAAIDIIANANEKAAPVEAA